MELRSHGSPENLAGMVRFGIATGNAYGASIASIRPIARRLGRDHGLAMKLWDTGVREARVLAIFVAEPKSLTPAQMNRWASQFDSWDLCDGCAIHLFRKTPHAWKLAVAWSGRKPEFVRRLGFAMFAALAVHDKEAPDQRFAALLPVIEKTASDERNFVKKAVNWALRQIGKRNAALRRQAIAVARRLAASESASERWVGKDALRELE
jgi:3-methyladenine DNA glycosylase AlkD